MTYDHAARARWRQDCLEARGGTVPASAQRTNLSYRQSYQFNAFNNLKQRNNLHRGVENWYGQSNNLSYTYQNDRITNQNWLYDADGRVLQSAAPDDWATSAYDARGLLIRHNVNDNYSSSYGAIQRFYNGDGREVKRGKINYAANPEATQWPYGSWTEDEPKNSQY